MSSTRPSLPVVGPVCVTLPDLHNIVRLLVSEGHAPTTLTAEAESSQKLLRLATVADGELGALRNGLDGRERDLGVASAIDHVVNVAGWQTGVVEARGHRVDGHTFRQLEPVRRDQYIRTPDVR